jgi:competence transcription factor ComK
MEISMVMKIMFTVDIPIRILNIFIVPHKRISENIWIFTTFVPLVKAVTLLSVKQRFIAHQSLAFWIFAIVRISKQLQNTTFRKLYVFVFTSREGDAYSIGSLRKS